MSEELSKLKLRLERFELLYQVSNVIHSTLEAQEALQLIVSEGVRLVKASSGSVVLLNPTSEFLEIHAAQPTTCQDGIPKANGFCMSRDGRASMSFMS